MKQPIAGVYRIYNNATKKNYIGQALDISRRWKYHLGMYKKHDSHLYSAMRKYGINCFEFSIEYLVESSLPNKDKKQLLDEAEIAYISIYESNNPLLGYNKTEGGEGGSLNPDTLKKRNEAIKKAWEDLSLRQEARDRTKGTVPVNCTFRGCHHSEESLAKQRKPKTGYVWKSKETALAKGIKSSIRAQASKWYHNDIEEKFIDLTIQQPPNGWLEGRLPFSNEYKKLQSKRLSGGGNPRAIGVRCVETNEVFSCLKDAANKYSINYASLSIAVKNHLSYKGYSFIKENTDGQPRV